jgi:M6 family metalloprotease-like protein
MSYPKPVTSRLKVALTGVAATSLTLAGLALLSTPTQAAPSAAAPAKAGYRGAPVNPAPYTLTQPDGTSIQVQRFGDKLSNGVATVKGNYSLVKGDDGYWRYAAGRTASGALKASGVVAGQGQPPAAAKGLAPAPDRKATQNEVPLGGVGDDNELVILVSFADQDPVGSTEAEWAARYFGAADSVDDFYDEASAGQFGLTAAAENCGTANNGVTNWLELPYAHPNTGVENNPDDYVADAIEAAAGCMNFAAFDANDDDELTTDELHVTVIGAGYETSYSGPDAVCDDGPSIWGHQWDLESGSTVGAPTVDGVTVGASGYTTFGEWHCEEGEAADPDGHMATIGIMAHEFGHDINWPDLYDVDQSGEGVGEWSLMGSGSWGQDPGAGSLAGDSPTHPDAWSLYYQGWVVPTEQSTAEDDIEVSPGESLLLNPNSGDVDWLFGEHTGTGEYFILENRNQEGYDQSTPGCGIVIYRVDETVSPFNDANADELDPLVKVIQADGNEDLELAVNRGDAGDPWPGSEGNNDLSDSTTPSARFYTGAPSGLVLHVDGVADECDSTMTVDVTQPGQASPPVVAPVNDDFAAATTISGASGTVQQSTKLATDEAGEPNPDDVGFSSVWFKWTAPSNGSFAANTRGSGFDTVLGLYTGSAVNALTELDANDDEVPFEITTSEVSSRVTKGTTYSIAADGWGGATGRLTLNWAFQADPKVASTTVAKAPKKVVFKRNFKVKATVSGTGGATGTVEVYKGKKRLGKGTLVNGTVKIKVKKNLKVGKHRLTVKYLGSDSLLASQDTVKVKIIKKKRRNN